MDMISQHELYETLREIVHLLREIRQELEKRLNHYSLHITQETTMALENITAGTTGQFGATLLDNGLPYSAPAGSSYVFTPAFTASDSAVTFTPATDDASSGTIPLADQIVVSIPASDSGTSVTITATATAPDGTTVTNSITVALTPLPRTYTLAISQLA